MGESPFPDSYHSAGNGLFLYGVVGRMRAIPKKLSLSGNKSSGGTVL